MIRSAFQPASAVVRRRGAPRVRQVALVVHRWVGLSIAAFLLVAGVTGSLLAFYVPLDTMLNPELFLSEPPTPGTPMLDPFLLSERFSAQLPASQREHLAGSVLLRQTPGKAQNFWVDGHEVFVNPYTAEIQGTRRFGALTGKRDVMTFLYELHFSLGLGEVGTFLFGVVALLWTVDCFVGAYLTFPQPAPKRGQGKAAEKPWLARWLPAWMVKTNKLFTLVFTFHRASGLWVWMMLLVFAWSAVALNLGEVYSPVMKGVLGAPPDHEAGLSHHDPPATMSLPLRDAHALGKRLMQAEAERRGFAVLGERGLAYDGEHDAYTYTIESSLDVSERLADTTLLFDARGRVLSFHAPTGQHPNSTLSSWLVALHFGAVREGGVVYRSIVCVLGLVVALLSITGVWIWLKRRPARETRKKLAAPPPRVRPRQVHAEAPVAAAE